MKNRFNILTMIMFLGFSFVCHGTKFKVVQESVPQDRIDLCKVRSSQFFRGIRPTNSFLDESVLQHSESAVFEPIPMIDDKDSQQANEVRDTLRFNIRKRLSETQEKIIKSVLDLYVFYKQNIALSTSRELELRHIVSVLGDDAGPFKELLNSEIQYNNYLRCENKESKLAYLREVLQNKNRYDILDEINSDVDNPIVIHDNTDSHSVSIMYKFRGKIVTQEVI